MFTATCGKTYKTERGIGIHENSRCKMCWGTGKIHEVAETITSRLEGPGSMDITVKQVNWLTSILPYTGILSSSYTRRSRWWFEIPGDYADDLRSFKVTVWPNGAGYIVKNSLPLETYAYQQEGIAKRRSEFREAVGEEKYQQVIA